MAEERPPPPVSIRDPSRPRRTDELPATPELLPRRPSRRTTGVVALLAVGLSRALHDRDVGRRERTQAVVDVVLATGVEEDPLPDGRYPTAAARVDLRNAGPAAVDVVGVSVLGWSATWARGPLAAGSQLAVQLTAPLDCRSLPQPEALTVRLRTTSGGVVVRRLPVTAQDLLYAALVDCGQVPVQGALGTAVGSARRVGRALEVDLRLSDASSAKLQLVSVTGDGARVVLRPRLPVEVPPRVPGRVPEPLTVHASVSVVSCAAALGGFFGVGLVSLELDAESGPSTIVTSRWTPSREVLSLTRQW